MSPHNETLSLCGKRDGLAIKLSGKITLCLGAVHKLCRLGRGEGGSTKEDLLHRPYLIKKISRGDTGGQKFVNLRRHSLWTTPWVVERIHVVIRLILSCGVKNTLSVLQNKLPKEHVTSLLFCYQNCPDLL